MTDLLLTTKTNRLLRDLLEGVTDGAVIMDSTMRICGCNSVASRVLGYSEEQISELSAGSIFLDVSTCNESDIQNQGLEVPALHADGSRIPVFLKISRLDIDGDTYFLYSLRDISRFKIAEEKAIQLGRILDDSLNEIYTFDANSLHFEQMNRGALLNLGLDESEVADLTPLDIKPEFSRESFMELVTPLLKGERQHLFFETVHQRRDGTVYPVEIRLQLSNAVASKPMFVAVVMDISIRKEVEQNLQDSEKRYRTVFNSGSDALEVLNPETGDIYEVNDTLLKLYGYSRDELATMKAWDLSNEPEKTRVAIRHPGDLDIENRHHRKKDGTVFPVEITQKRINYKGEPLVIASIRDISERVRSEKKLEDMRKEASKNRAHLAHVNRLHTFDEMAANIAHEINQPLSAVGSYIRACISRIEQGDFEKEKILDILDKTSLQVNRAAGVLDRVQSIMKKEPANKEVVRVSDLLQDTVMLAEIDARAHDCCLAMMNRAGGTSVVVDKVQIQQVIMNLIRNSIDAVSMVYDAERKTISILAQEDSDGYVEIRITDRGEGVRDPECLFNTFYSTKKSGMGIGLSICKTIVESHGGTINYLPGRTDGSVFIFRLPVSGIPG